LSTWASVEIFPEGETLPFYLSFSGCWRYNADGGSQNALPFLHHQENSICYSKSHKNCASLTAMLIFLSCILSYSMKTTSLGAIGNSCIPALPTKHVCFQQSNAAKRLLP